MPDTNIREAETLPVQLTRMEGTINLIKYQSGDMLTRVTHLETSSSRIESKVQKLELEAVARDATAVALATALKQADDNYKDKTTGKWTPLNRVYLIAGIIYAMVILYKTFRP